MESISEVAARWAVRGDASGLTAEEERQLKAWLDADPRHRGAYVRARVQWLDLDRLAALNGPVIPGEERFLAGTPANTATPAARTVPVLSRRQLVAAGVAAVAVVGSSSMWMTLRDGRESYVSAIGEVRRIALADGSTIVLNTDTQVMVQLTRQQRSIQLMRGEALFEVAHDKTRPFIVTARGTAIRAVGTAFVVRVNAAQINVTVTEGVVEVDEGTGSASPAAKRVAANQRLVVGDARSAEIETIPVMEADRQLAWRTGMVSFDGESLATAVAEINRHNHRQIVIDDPSLAERPVIGVFRTTDLDGFSAAAAVALKASAVADGQVIRLRPDADQTSN